MGNSIYEIWRITENGPVGSLVDLRVRTDTKSVYVTIDNFFSMLKWNVIQTKFFDADSFCEDREKFLLKVNVLI